MLHSTYQFDLSHTANDAALEIGDQFSEYEGIFHRVKLGFLGGFASIPLP